MTEQKQPKIVRGVKAIADIIEEPNESRVYYLLEKGHVPGAFKEGRTWGLSVPAFMRARHGEAA